MGRLYAAGVMRISLHRRMIYLLTALLLLAVGLVPPLALAMPAGQAPVMPDHQMTADCAAHHAAGQETAAPAKTVDHPCKNGCAACTNCIFVQAALLPAAGLLSPRPAALAFLAEVPRLHLIRRNHPPLRPPSI